MRTELRGLVLVLAASVAFADPLVGSSVGNADTFVSEGSKLFNKKQYAKAWPICSSKRPPCMTARSKR